MQQNDSRSRVVVTGMGVISPLGLDTDTLWTSLLAGESPAARITRFDPSDFLVQIGCETNDFDPLYYVDRKDARRFDRATQFAVACATQAVEQACLDINDSNANRIGVVFGTALGALSTIHEGYEMLYGKGPMRVSPLVGPRMLPDMASGQIAITFGVRGPNHCVISACATGNTALGEAAEVIRRGDADVMIAGSTDAPMTPFALAAFHRTGAMSTRNDDPKRACRPFDAHRDGLVFGEGAGAMVLETLEHARARGATPLAEIAGYGSSNDAFHISAPAEDGIGAVLSMQRALDDAGLQPEDVDYINAHGTSTALNDPSETRAIKRVFGEYAYQVPISSTKSMTGHMMGAAGTVEGIVSIKTMETGTIHPTINYEYPDPECDLDYVPNEPRKADVRVVLSNAFGFGGHNATIVFKKIEDE
ncbi:MAG: beta-ketoacyl-ACP synthase II [Anaerolineae bacterium]